MQVNVVNIVGLTTIVVRWVVLVLVLMGVVVGMVLMVGILATVTPLTRFLISRG